MRVLVLLLVAGCAGDTGVVETCEEDFEFLTVTTPAQGTWSAELVSATEYFGEDCHPLEMFWAVSSPSSDVEVPTTVTDVQLSDEFDLGALAHMTEFALCEVDGTNILCGPTYAGNDSVDPPIAHVGAWHGSFHSSTEGVLRGQTYFMESTVPRCLVEYEYRLTFGS